MSNMIGKQAPDFSGLNQHGKEISLGDFEGKKLVLYFYPKDNTPGCTTQSCNLRDNYALLQEKGFSIIGVSTDGVKSHEKFATKYDLPFDLLADEDKKAVNDYRVWGEKSMFGVAYQGIKRETFVIDEKGIIISHITKVSTKNHTEQILESLEM